MISNEPGIVTRDRQLILDTFGDLVFVEEGHKYYRGGIELPSVSAVTHKYKPEFDSLKVASGYAKKHGETPEYWLREWKFKNLKATTSGTLVHEYGEGLFWLRYGRPDLIPISSLPKYVHDEDWLIPTSPKEEAILKFYTEMSPHDWQVLAETKVYNNFSPSAPPMMTSYCGTFDILFYREDPGHPENSGYVVKDFKGLDINTPIFTKNRGWITMETIQVGDIVYDKNGNETKVLNTSGIHHKPCYKITFTNSNTIVCDEDHRWEVSTIRRYNKENHINSQVKTAKEIFEYLEGLNKRTPNNILRIMMNDPIKGKEKELPIDPYVLGVWLGDGSRSCGLITNMYDDLWKEIEKRGYKLGNDVSKGGSGKALGKTILGLRSKLKKLNLINNKHIPAEYLTASYEQRLDLLRGFMDTDGHYNKKRKRYVMATTRLWQKEAMEQLLGSLGIKSTSINATTYATNTKDKRKIKAYHITFSDRAPYPFLIRQLNVEHNTKNRDSNWVIKKVECVDTIPTRCIEVDSPTHTYLYGYNFITTHNTNKELISNYSRAKHKMCLPPFSDLPDEAFSMYTLQLSCYQIPLEDLGLKVIGREIIWLKDSGDYEIIQVPDITARLRNVL